MNNLISAFIGAILSIMIMFNGVLTKTTGNYISIVVIHIVGLFSIILILLIRKSKFKLQNNIPLYWYSAGAIGVITVLFTNLSFLELGVSVTIALGLLGQSISSIIIDNFGLLGMDVVKFEKKKFIGLIFIAIGILIMTIF